MLYLLVHVDAYNLRNFLPWCFFLLHFDPSQLLFLKTEIIEKVINQNYLKEYLLAVVYNKKKGYSKNIKLIKINLRLKKPYIIN